MLYTAWKMRLSAADCSHLRVIQGQIRKQRGLEAYSLNKSDLNSVDFAVTVFF